MVLRVVPEVMPEVTERSLAVIQSLLDSEAGRGRARAALAAILLLAELVPVAEEEADSMGGRIWR
jgi:hypothetical protein